MFQWNENYFACLPVRRVLIHIWHVTMYTRTYWKWLLLLEVAIVNKSLNCWPPRWTTYVVRLEGFPSLLKAPSSGSLTAGGPPKKEQQRLRGSGPCRSPPRSPPEVCVIYSVWEHTDPLLFERSVNRLLFHCLRLIRDLRRDFLCTYPHAHTISQSSE